MNHTKLSLCNATEASQKGNNSKGIEMPSRPKKSPDQKKPDPKK